MRTLVTQSTLTLSQTVYYNTPATSWRSLLHLVQSAVTTQEHAQDALTTRAQQKRRAPARDEYPAKRIKLATGTGHSTPSLSDDFPVYREQYHIQYTVDNTTDLNSTPAEYNQLLSFLHERYEDQEDDAFIDIGTFDVTPRAPGFTVDYPGQDVLLSLFPSIRDPSEGKLSEWMENLVDIQKQGCEFAKLSASPRIVIPAHSALTDTKQVPFRIHVNLTLSFSTPHLFNPAPSIPKQLKALLDIRSRLLKLAFPPSPLDPALRSVYHDRVDIPFYYASINAAPPLSSDCAMERAQPSALIPALLPFQRRTVGWMLEKEGKRISEDGEIVDISSLNSDAQALPPLWERVTVAASSGESVVWYYHRLTGNIQHDFPTDDRPVPGAIVAEEPGLGKTLECISLILLNSGAGRSPTQAHWDPIAELNVNHVKTTLIVTPSSLMQQWVDEMNLHAPSLKVLVYDGWTKLPRHVEHSTKNSPYITTKAPRVPAKGGKTKKTGHGADKENKAMDVDGAASGPITWAEYVNSFDVCITTYTVLQHDLNVARAPPKRPRRDTAEYSRTTRSRSPLVCVEFFRVIMDEVQMVGGGRTSEMVSLIPRHSSFAVSGTPARHQISDLVNVLRFLRAKPAILESRTWSRLLGPEMVSEFVQLMQFYTTRTMKTAVKDELTIPQQTRFLVPVELGRVERHVYDQQMEKCLQELGLDARGVAATENWEIDTTQLRSWLRKLRMICTHPQVGQLNKSSGDKAHKSGILKSMSEVLDDMRDQNWRTLMDSRRQKANELARAAQLIQRDRSTNLRHKQALDILGQAEQEARGLVEELKVAIAEHDTKGEALKQEAAALQRSRELSDDTGKGKGKARADISSDGEDDDDSGLPRTPAGEEHRRKKTALQNRLRDAYLSLHRVKFLQGDVHHVLGTSQEADEAAAYAAAEELRKILLQFTEDAAISAMAQLGKDTVGRGGFMKNKFIIETPYSLTGGIRTKEFMEEANNIIENGLNAQTELLWEWREQIHRLLTQPLNAAEAEDADGQEYSRTLATQGDAEIYLQVYKALLADRREILVAERTMLAAHESREKKKRKTAAAAKAELDKFIDDELEVPDEDDVAIQPEHQVLHKELSALRRDIMARFDGRAIKSIIVQLAGVSAKIANDKDMEKIIAKECAADLRKLITEQSHLNEILESDLARFRKAFNERILYFRQLQEISDTVMEAEWDGSIEDAINENSNTLEETNAKIKTARARQRYLNHLAQEGMDEDDDCCILCRCEFRRGYITECAHVFCEDCMKSWLSNHKACPVCRVAIYANSLQRFYMQANEADVSSGAPAKLTQGGEVMVPLSRRKIEYNTISSSTVEDINTMECAGSYGSKIEMLLRHLLYLQLIEPGAKSIVFSAFQDSLHIVEHALRTNGIPCLRVDDGQGNKRKGPAAVRFQKDPELQVLLLHGERENAGLNVTCASRVFLLESVVHHSFEIQAIARIDRMGQSRPTEVFCYYAEETVEKSILDLAARQGLSLYTKEKSKGTLDVAPLAPDSEQNIVDAPAKKQKGDFIFKLDDMMSILFPHLVEDVEYLLPPAEEEAEATIDNGNASVRVNAVAGPSRLG